MLSSFIRRNGKRKGNKVNESRCHQQSPSTSSSIVLPFVFDIKEESPSLSAAQGSPLVELNLSDSNEGWFPQELLQSRSCSPGSSSSRTLNDTATQSDITQETHVDPSSGESPSHSRTASTGVVFRKKSIPAPILIPGAGLLTPNVQIGHSAVSTGAPPPEAPQPNANAAALNPPSPSASEDLSSISGTTLARALIASSFTLSSSEHRSSRRRSGVVRQDSATLPRGDVLFLSHLGRPSSIPPVPPVHEKVISAPSKLGYPSTINSGASTESEYPLSDAYITSPEIGSVNPRRIFCIQEIPSSTASTSTKASPSTVPDATPQRKVDLVSPCTQAVRNGVFDGPKTAIEVPLPINSQEATQHQEGLFSLSLEGHTLDEFDFVPPEPLVAVASPDSDSSASYLAPLPKRNVTIRGQRRRRIGGSNLVRNTSKNNYLTEGHEGYVMSSAAMSEHDYGELLNYDLTVSPESSSSSHGPSSASAGYQTFPETPMIFSPLGSPGYTFLAKSDSQLRKRPPSPKYVRLGLGKPYSSVRTVRRQVDNNNGVGGAVALRRSQSSSLPRQKAPSPKQAKLSLSPLPQENDEVGNPGVTIQSSGTSPAESQSSLELQTTVRRHPLAHISSSSSYLPEEEALRALAQRSSLSLSSILIGDVDPSDPMAVAAAAIDPSVELPVYVPLPESTNVSPSSSPVSTGSITAPSPFTSPLQSSTHSSATAISQSHPLKSPFSAPSSSLGGSSFLPSPLSPASSNESHSWSVSPAPIISGVSDELISHSRPPSFVPPPPYHTVVSERTSHHPDSISTPSLPRTPPIDPGYQRSRQASNSSVVSGPTRTRVRARPPLPIGPRRPSGPGQIPGAFVPGLHDRNGSISSVGSPTGSPKSVWRKLQSAASKPPPKFQTPPPKWRALTLEAAHWTFTSAQLQQIVSQAIQQSSEGSTLRLLRLETLEGEIADEVHRLELQHTDVKAQYKALVRKRWTLMGALAGHIEGVEMNDTPTASCTMGELTEVLLALDHLAEKMHEIALQLAQLKSLREVHNASALAMVVRKINGLFVRQMAEKERLAEQVGALQTERDEAWKHAENIAQDYDTLNERVADVGARADVGVNTASPGDAQSSTSSRRSTRISAVRKSSVRLSQAGLRSRSKLRSRRSSTSAPRPTSLTLEDIPPIPSLPVNVSPQMCSAIDTAVSLGSVYSSNTETSEAWELAQAQREVYGMLGLSVPPSQASLRRWTVSDPDDPRPLLSSRPASESFDMHVRSREDRGRATKSIVLDDRHPVVRPLTVAQHSRIVTPL